MKLQFVESTDGRVDPAARRGIRSHVMRGKNVGKIRASRVPKGDLDRPSHSVDVLVPDGTLAGHEKATCIPPRVGNSFSFLTFKHNVEPYTIECIFAFMSYNTHAVFPQEICLPPDMTRNRLWFEFVQSDEAFFHSVVAMSDVLAYAARDRQDTSRLTLHHLALAYRCIASNLETQEVPSDSTAAAVVSMAIHEDLANQLERTTLHMQALQRIVELWGGIEKMQDREPLFSKLCRADVEYALKNGSRPFFYQDNFPQESIVELSRKADVDQKEQSPCAIARITHPALLSVVKDMMSVTALLNRDSSARIPPDTYNTILLSVCYRLLYISPSAGDDPQRVDEEAMQLGILALLTGLLFQYAHPWRIKYDILAARLLQTITKRIECDDTNSTFILWLLFASGTTVLDSSTNPWLTKEIAMRTHAMRLDNWDDIRSKLKLLPWICCTHDNAGKRLWEESSLNT